MARWLWILSGISSRLWVRASIYGLIGVVTALGAIYLKNFIPQGWPQSIGADAVDNILNILAASMLSVTIFSLGSMVSAYGAATNNVTPRATKLLIEDKLSHKALSTFIGAFIFSIVGIIALHTGIYGESGRLVLFIVTIGVIVMILVMLLRWIEYLTRLGRVGETIERVEQVTTQSLEHRLRMPYLGGVPLTSEKEIPKVSLPIHAGLVGYIEYIDIAAISHIADRAEASVYIIATPGKFVSSSCPLAYIHGVDDENILHDIRKAFVIGKERSFEQDPRFGIAVLCEIGSRALSSAINDSGTPIHVIGVGVRVLSIWAKRQELAGDTPPHYPRVHVPPLQINDLFDDFFTPLSRDGAGLMEVMIRLHKALQALAATGDAELAQAARLHAKLALKRSQEAFNLEEDRLKLAEIAAPLV